VPAPPAAARNEFSADGYETATADVAAPVRHNIAS
jgi:hypothetical protein